MIYDLEESLSKESERITALREKYKDYSFKAKDLIYINGE